MGIIKKAINKVIINDEIKLDLTEDTVTPKSLAIGYTAHDRTGRLIEGTSEGGFAGTPTAGDTPLSFCSGVASAPVSSTPQLIRYQDEILGMIAMAPIYVTLPKAGTYLIKFFARNPYTASEYGENKAQVQLYMASVLGENAPIGTLHTLEAGFDGLITEEITVEETIDINVYASSANSDAPVTVYGLMSCIDWNNVVNDSSGDLT